MRLRKLIDYIFMKKITLLYLILLVVVLSAAAFFFVGSKPNLEELKNAVAPSASLYPEAKSASDQLHFIDDDSNDTHLSEVTDGKWALLYFGTHPALTFVQSTYLKST